MNGGLLQELKNIVTVVIEKHWHHHKCHYCHHMRHIMIKISVTIVTIVLIGWRRCGGSEGVVGVAHCRRGRSAELGLASLRQGLRRCGNAWVVVVGLVSLR